MKRKSLLSKIIIAFIIVLLINIAHNIYNNFSFVKRYDNFGLNYNLQREKNGVELLPAHFTLIQSPFKNWYNFIRENNNFEIIYQSDSKIPEKYFKKEIIVEEKKIIREFDYYNIQGDTIVSTYNYY